MYVYIIDSRSTASISSVFCQNPVFIIYTLLGDNVCAEVVCVEVSSWRYSCKCSVAAC